MKNEKEWRKEIEDSEPSMPKKDQTKFLDRYDLLMLSSQLIGLHRTSFVLDIALELIESGKTDKVVFDTLRDSARRIKESVKFIDELVK